MTKQTQFYYHLPDPRGKPVEKVQFLPDEVWNALPSFDVDTLDADMRKNPKRQKFIDAAAH